MVNKKSKMKQMKRVMVYTILLSMVIVISMSGCKKDESYEKRKIRYIMIEIFHF